MTDPWPMPKRILAGTSSFPQDPGRGEGYWAETVSIDPESLTEYVRADVLTALIDAAMDAHLALPEKEANNLEEAIVRAGEP